MFEGGFGEWLEWVGFEVSKGIRIWSYKSTRRNKVLLEFFELKNNVLGDWFGRVGIFIFIFWLIFVFCIIVEVG